MSRSTFSFDDIVIKSPNDKRLYRFIRLDNGLSALLVHDPDIYPDSAPPKFTDCSDPEVEEGEDTDDEDSCFDEDEYSEDDGLDDGEEDERRESHSSSSQTKKVSSLSLFIASSSCFSF